MRQALLVCLLAACSSAMKAHPPGSGGDTGEGGDTGPGTGGKAGPGPGTGGKAGPGTGGAVGGGGDVGGGGATGGAAGGSGGVVGGSGGATGGAGGTPRDGGAPTATGPGVTARGYDDKRTGAYLGETVLKPDMVKTGSFGRLYCRPVDDEIYGSILYIPGVDLGAKGRHDVLLVVTMNDSVYAFDAADATGPALWEKHYTDPAMGITAVPTRDLAKTTCGTYQDITAKVGILSTPALDVAAGTAYLLARTKENGRYVQRLHAISIADGSERPMSPVEIKATYPGSGDGSSNGMITFNPMRQNQRAALVIHDGVVLIAWSSHCDEGPYHGWILGYDTKTLAQVLKYMDTPDGVNGGIWMAGMAPSIDDDGSIFITTGNGSNIPAGTIDTDVNRFKGGESILRLQHSGNTLKLMDWFTPSTYVDLERTDRDLGGCGAMLVPGSNLLITGSKEGKLFVVDRKNLGHQTTDDGQAVQVIQVTARDKPEGGPHIHGTPVYWKSTAGEFVYVMAEQDYLRQYRLTGGKLQLYKMSAVKGPIDPMRPPSYTMPGGTMTLSASGGDPNSGILWLSMPVALDANNATVPGVLRAFKASDVSMELWNSQQAGNTDTYGLYAKFNPPTVYNGRVYQPSFSKQFCVYGPK
jgi:hypothetical protein